MKNSILFAAFLVFAVVATNGQPATTSSSTTAKFDAEIALAKRAVEAHGGEKLRSMKTLILRGSADVTTSAFNQAIPATFVVILARDKYRFEILNPFQPVKQVFDGVNTSTTIRGGMTLPPITRVGFPLLQRVGDPGFVITPLPDVKKKAKGFRITSPDGYATDFYLSEKTNQIKGYDSRYDLGSGRVVTTSVEIDSLRVVDGVSVPDKYAQRFDTEQVTVYAVFKTKEILVNSEIEENIFTTTQ